MPRLCREDALAYTPRHAEFQEGRTIINVRFPEHGERSMWLARASIAFDAVWNELPHIVAFATAHLRVKQRERWRRYDEAGLVDTLAVHGIWIDVENGSASCHVSCNVDLRQPRGLPPLTEDDVVFLTRWPSGWLTVEHVSPPPMA
ncbi:MAG TPA: hypothetical protein VN153_00655 [Tahibacter sp.]|nr:hypothetical protein [Tahibacter sp.]